MLTHIAVTRFCLWTAEVREAARAATDLEHVKVGTWTNSSKSVLIIRPVIFQT